MSALVSTRRSLHAVAELLLAGPQYAAHGTIKLSVTPEGFATTCGPAVAVAGDLLRIDGREIPLAGRTISVVAAEAGLVPNAPSEVYADGCGLDAAHLLVVDPDAAAELHEAFGCGDQALAAFAPDHERVLWPEHFDLGVTVAEVNYGVSPGDGYCEVPYAYVGPWSLDGLAAPFWNAPFGAARPVRDLDDLGAFFAEGAGLLRRDEAARRARRKVVARTES